jgi:hypothetical protein
MTNDEYRVAQYSSFVTRKIRHFFMTLYFEKFKPSSSFLTRFYHFDGLHDPFFVTLDALKKE